MKNIDAVSKAYAEVLVKRFLNRGIFPTITRTHYNRDEFDNLETKVCEATPEQISAEMYYLCARKNEDDKSLCFAPHLLEVAEKMKVQEIIDLLNPVLPEPEVQVPTEDSNWKPSRRPCPPAE
ncbi:MAG: hypothetical protein GY793_12120 [Proteobacteria bacterium]|nr:hypothetical protein [Pseudomonadota bacterium]